MCGIHRKLEQGDKVGKVAMDAVLQSWAETGGGVD